MATAYKPFFSTTYGDGFGYNEREGVNHRTFRNRYLDATFKSAAAAGPTRFHATEPLAATAVPATARFSEPLAATVHARYGYGAPAAGADRLQWTNAQFQAAAGQRLAPHPPGIGRAPFAADAAAPQAEYLGVPHSLAATGAAFSPVSARAASSFPVSAIGYGGGSALGFHPIEAPAHQTLSALPAGDWSYSTTSSTALLTLPPGVYDVRGALSWDGKGPRPAAIGPGGPLPAPHPLLPPPTSSPYAQRVPSQQIPFGRLSAMSPAAVSARELRAELSATAAAIAADPSIQNIPPEIYKTQGMQEYKLESAANYGKLSITRRLKEKEKLRYHLPGYCGFVRSIQFRHGDTFGKSTRKALLDTPENL